MHYVDLSIHDVIAGKDVAYLRFCDDMILVTADEKLASEVLDIYIYTKIEELTPSSSSYKIDEHPAHEGFLERKVSWALQVG